MKKTYLLWFAVLAFLLAGCRNDNFNPNDAHNNQQALKFRIIPKSQIPEIINLLQTKTNNFRVFLKKRSVSGKTETVFGDINTDYIIESTNADNQVYYTFPIVPGSGSASETYNLSVKAGTDIASAKVIAYDPSPEWMLNANDDYSVFSGDINSYSIDGTLENSVAYINGTSDCNPQPCPDCPANPQGPGNPGGGGGYPPTQGPGSPPTGSGGPISYPGSGGGGGSSSGGCGGWVLSYTIYQDGYHYGVYTNSCGDTMKLRLDYKTSSRAPAPTCGQNDQTGGGVIITTQNDDPCTVLKKQNNHPGYKEKITALDKSPVLNLKNETGYSENKNGVFADLPVSQNTEGRNALVIKVNADTKGYIHTHLNDSESGTYDDNGNPKMREPIRMFSPADVNALMTMAQHQTDGNYGNLYGTMVSSYGNYTIKFTGVTTDIKTGFDTDDWRKAFTLYKINNKKWSLEKLLLTFLKDEMKVNGISLYKIKNNGTIQQKELGSDGKVKSTDCPK